MKEELNKMKSFEVTINIVVNDESTINDILNIIQSRLHMPFPDGEVRNIEVEEIETDHDES